MAVPRAGTGSACFRHNPGKLSCAGNEWFQHQKENADVSTRIEDPNIVEDSELAQINRVAAKHENARCDQQLPAVTGLRAPLTAARCHNHKKKKKKTSRTGRE